MRVVSPDSCKPGCPACARVCPVGAIIEQDHIEKVWAALDDPSMHVMVQTAPAIANALYDAVGIRFSDLPLSADKIYLAMEKNTKLDNNH